MESQEKRYQGIRVTNSYGDVQVSITLRDGEIIDLDAVVDSDGDSYSEMLNEDALPVLKEQALAAQSAEIDGVTGATYTSESYKESLQSAIDQAKPE